MRSITDSGLALFAALAVSVHLLEAGIPSPVPGIKPGLANVVTLVVLLRYGLGAAAWVSVLRVFAGGLLLGTFLGPTFVLSLAGALGALAALALTHALGRRVLGPVGYAVPAALCHVAAQVVVAWLLFIPHPGIWQLGPVLLAFATLTGILTGIIANAILVRLPVRPDVE